LVVGGVPGVAASQQGHAEASVLREAAVHTRDKLNSSTCMSHSATATHSHTHTLTNGVAHDGHALLWSHV
jgi:hypothetical protein